MSIEVNSLTATSTSGGTKVRQELRHAVNRALDGQCSRLECGAWLLELTTFLGLEATTDAGTKALLQAAAAQLATDLS